MSLRNDFDFFTSSAGAWRRLRNTLEWTKRSVPFGAPLVALLFAILAVHGNAQGQLAPPGSFDPRTETAHQKDPVDLANNPSISKEGNARVAPGNPVKMPGRVILPSSSARRPQDLGLRAHTNYLVFAPQGRPDALGQNLMNPDTLVATATATPSLTFAENPGSLGCVYQVVQRYPGCTPAGGVGHHPTGGKGAIAIVDAYHNPEAAADLAAFNATWGLPAANFEQIYCEPSPGTCSSGNTPPPTNANWGLEEALDIEWAHAMAPDAKIFLIEAASNSYEDLTWAVAWAGYFVEHAGGGEVSLSWGGQEFAGEIAYDAFLNNYFGNYYPVVYIASGGDGGTVEWPSASPYVVSAGGTTVNRDASGNFLSQTCWAGTGRGISKVESRPVFQNVVSSLVGSNRGTTDLSFDADPASGAWVYDALNGGWLVVGGTSLAAPALAGILNNAGNKFASSFRENNLLYGELTGAVTYPSHFYDVSPAGYDFCTGIGTPKTLIGK